MLVLLFPFLLGLDDPESQLISSKRQWLAKRFFWVWRQNMILAMALTVQNRSEIAAFNHSLYVYITINTMVFKK